MHRKLLLCSLLAVSLTGCASPLVLAVKKTAPKDFREVSPVTTEIPLGARILRTGYLWWASENPATNDCFIGVRAPKNAGISEMAMTYGAGADADLKADFGTKLKGNLSGSGDRRVDVKLKDLELVSFTDLQFNPSSNCLDLVNGKDGNDPFVHPAGVYFDLLTEGLKVGSIDIKDTANGEGKIKVNTELADGATKVGGTASVSGDGTTTWNGVNLFIAQRVSRFVVKRLVEECRGPVGQACPLVKDTCSFMVTEVKDNKWWGEISCAQVGAPLVHEFKDVPFGRMQTVLKVEDPNNKGISRAIAPGRSLNVTVESRPDNTIYAKFRQWVVINGSTMLVTP